MWKHGVLQAPWKLQALLGYSSISAVVESLLSTFVLPVRAEVPFVQQKPYPRDWLGISPLGRRTRRRPEARGRAQGDVNGRSPGEAEQLV